MLLWIHPVLQALATLSALHVLHLGWVRFQSAHMGRKGGVFQWKTHVRQGVIAMALWTAGLAGGMWAAQQTWTVLGITGTHYWVGLCMLPLMAFGLATGWRMDKVKARRRALPLLHGAANLLLVLLALWQVATGVVILRDMVLV
jgi:hypothetical protein